MSQKRLALTSDAASGTDSGDLSRVLAVVDVRLLGPLEVVDAADLEVSVPGTRPRALLALLALHAPEAISVDRIIEALWGDEPVQNPESALHVAVSRLRSAIGEDSVETMAGGYRLGIPVANCDIERFRRHTQRGRQLLTLGHPAKAAEGFRHALAQWHGDPLSDLRKFEFAEQAARQLEEERLGVVERLMEAELAAGNHELVIGELSGLVESFPYRERLWAHLMLALYRSGRQAEALRTFTRVKALLGEDLGIEPERELVDLEERILLHDPALEDLREPAAREWTEEPELLNFTTGEVIVSEGAPADSVYWIETGQVEVTKTTSDGQTVVLAELGPGRYFGELASLLGTGRTASVRAATATTVSVHTADSFRSRLGAERAKDAADAVPAEAIRELIRDVQNLEAYDQATSMLESGVVDPEIRYLAVLALKRSRATEHARRRYEGLGLASVDPSAVSPRLAEDIAALAPGLDKDMALSRPGGEGPGWARRSAEGYESAFARFPSAYLAANAATMWLVAEDRERAQKAARDALNALVDWDQLGEDDRYWEAASEAEAAIALGEMDRAAEALTRAGEVSEGNHASRATTLHQLKMVCGLLDIDPSILAPIANAAVVHFCGHRVLAPGENGRFPPDQEPRVAAELKEAFDRLRVGFGFGSLAAGADILAAEALAERGAELRVVLPFDRDEFVRTSVAPAGADWVTRFERCLGAAEGVTTAITGEYLDDPVLFDFCSQIAMGDALMRARSLESEAHQVAVWDGIPTGGTAGTAVDVARWHGTGRTSTVISIEPTSDPQPTESVEPVRHIRGIVFGDFAGFSTLSDGQLIVFQERVMGGLAKAIEPFQPHVLSGRTWGDSLYLVFDDIAAAAACTLTIQDTIREMDFDQLGLPTLRSMRVAAHATPVFDGRDPISGTRLFFGAGVTQTARIEPRTPEGEIYTTYPFAALAVLVGDQSFDTQYVGTLPTAKGYGSLPLFALRRRL
ncbi:MAG: BTAD domain-containing putative transcriptional regulator [Acidimicrobiia bacterium]